MKGSDKYSKFDENVKNLVVMSFHHLCKNENLNTTIK